MAEALAAGQSVRARTSPNPWVGAVVLPAAEQPVAVGATEPPGGRHAEIVAMDLAGDSTRGATLYVTLEPCSHFGRTPPCADAVVAAGISRVVVGTEDPDPNVGGRGIQHLRDAGVDVTVGVLSGEVGRSLAPYLAHRTRGTPWVVLKLAATLDGRIAAADGSSKWITGPEARADAHALRAESDAILVGAGTVRADDPLLTVRDADGRNPMRVVLGHPPEGSRTRPDLIHSGPIPELLQELAGRGVIQLLVEGGSHVAGTFHRMNLVDQYVIYMAPAFLGGDDGLPLFSGAGAATMAEAWRGRLDAVRRIGPDVRIDVLAGQ